MITGNLIHPQLLAAVARAGHGAHVLVLDGHYPASTAVRERAEQVFLNLAPGLLDTSTVLRVLLTAMTVESAAVMVPPSRRRRTARRRSAPGRPTRDQGRPAGQVGVLRDGPLPRRGSCRRHR